MAFRLRRISNREAKGGKGGKEGKKTAAAALLPNSSLVQIVVPTGRHGSEKAPSVFGLRVGTWIQVQRTRRLHSGAMAKSPGRALGRRRRRASVRERVSPP